MPEVRRRRVAESKTKPVSRRRDRVDDDDVDDEDDLEEVDATERPVRARTAKKSTTRRRRPEPEDDEDEDDVDDEADDDDEDEEEEERPRKRVAKKTSARRRRPRPDDDDDDEDDDDEPPPRKRTSSKEAAPARRKRRRPDDEDELPLGVKSGLAGVEEVRRMSNGGVTRLALSKEPELVKCLDKAPLLTFRQHWVPAGGGQSGNRPHTCIGQDCPLCELGDNANQTIVFNVLHLSGSGKPEVKLLQMGIRAYNAFKDAATHRGSEQPKFDKDYWAINKSGRDQQSQTNFRPIKLRDIEEDWEEVLDHFDLDELDEIVAEAQEGKFDKKTVAQGSTRKQLREVAKYLADDEDDE